MINLPVDEIKEFCQTNHIKRLSLFGSVLGNNFRPDSDIDVLVDLDPAHPIGVFQYARIKLDIAALLDGSADVVNRKTLKPLLRDAILHDAVNAF